MDSQSANVPDEDTERESEAEGGSESEGTYWDRKAKVRLPTLSGMLSFLVGRARLQRPIVMHPPCISPSHRLAPPSLLFRACAAGLTLSSQTSARSFPPARMIRTTLATMCSRWRRCAAVVSILPAMSST